MTHKEIKTKVNRSSLGTQSARLARRSVSNATSARIVALSKEENPRAPERPK